ncbi:MAG TPA: hypothetical protein ENN80_07015 [Candidatus Hydrogenedentes bacterium]|nr:hypothetical protein [Candidatus Hydrogenedentota bacterium]
MTKATTAKAHRKGAGRVAFLARADLFRSLLNAGHPQRSIYDDHAADLGISYSQFNRYVRKYLLGKADDHEHQKGPSPAPAPTAGPGQQPAKPGKPGFSHNANSGNDRDDLI